MNLADTRSTKIESYIDTSVIMSIGYYDCFDDGLKYFEQGNYSAAIKNYLEALDMAVEYQREDLQLQCHDQLSLNYFRRYEFDSMLNHATEANALSEKLGNVEIKVTALNRIGIAYGSFGVNEEALKYFLKSVSLAEPIKHKDLPIIYNNISVIYHHLGNLHGSLPYLEKGLNLAIENDEKSHQLTCLCNFGERFTELGRYKEALSHLKEALNLVKNYDESNIIIVTIYENIGDCCFEQEKFILAAKAYEKGLNELTKRPNDHLKSGILLKLSKVQSAQGKTEHALTHLQQGLEAAEASNNLKTKFEIHKALSDIFKGAGDFKMALDHFEDFHNTRELVRGEDAQNRLQGMMVKFDVERVQKEKELAEKEQELAELKYVELAQLHERLEEQSRLDPLTQISNRGFLDDFLANEYLKAVRLSRSISVMMCDVDFFKKINDGFSHSVGDDVLRILSKLLKDNLRKDDLVARYGGEEFVVVFPQTQFEQAIKVAEKLRKIIEAYPWESVAKGLAVTMSAGIASGTKYPSYEKLLARADLKLYEAKDAGRNQVKY